MLSRSRLGLRDRRGAILVFAAVLMIVIFAFTAFTIDVGYIAVTKAELQNAADAAALGACVDIPDGSIIVRSTARNIGLENLAAGTPVDIPNTDISLGIFDFVNKTFSVNETNPNAVRVITRVGDEPFFFAPVMGQNAFDASAQAIAMLNPRDIVFVVDLSGSMNDDTEPCWAFTAINDQFGPLGYPGVATALMQQVYDDFGFGAFPGPYQHVGQSAGVAPDRYAYAELTRDDGPLTALALAAPYRIFNSDDEATRKIKAYRWMIDFQIATLMPGVPPAADSTLNYTYWEQYLDYVIDDVWVGDPPPPPPPSGGGGGGGGGGSGGGGGGGGGGGSPPPPTPPLGQLVPPDPDVLLAQRPDSRILAEVASTHPTIAAELLLASSAAAATLPGMPRRGANDWQKVPTPKDGGHEIDAFNNPNHTTFPAASSSLPDAWEFKIGYITYVQFMMDWGRDRTPQADNSTSANPALAPKTPLSRLSPYCPMHTESTAGGSFSFPPSEQPMHAVRRSLIAALQVVKQRNTGIGAGSGDRVSIVTFDALSPYHAPQILMPLTADYDAAMLVCTTLQAVGDIGATTATEVGMRYGRDVVRNTTAGGQGRPFARKVMVLLTDGVPNVWESSSASVDGYIAAGGSSEYYGSAYVWYNAALVQAARATAEHVDVYPVGMGLGADYDFLDRMARVAGTDEAGSSPRGSGNPAEYEQVLTDIFTEIIENPGSRLVH